MTHTTTRRGFFGLLGAAAITPLVPELELLIPTRTIFLPPVGGWLGRNQLLTVAMIQREAYRVLHQNLEFTAVLNREYDHEWLRGDQWTPAEMANAARIVIRKPRRYES